MLVQNKLIHIMPITEDQALQVPYITPQGESLNSITVTVGFTVELFNDFGALNEGSIAIDEQYHEMRYTFTHVDVWDFIRENMGSGNILIGDSEMLMNLIYEMYN